MPVDLLSVYPHAHYLGKEMRVTATLPDGAVKSLLHIKQWNFHWQQDYRYVTPIPLPRGTTLTMRYTFDNSAANRDNPSHPPVRVQARAAIGRRDGGARHAGDAEVARRTPRGSPQSFDERDTLANVALGEIAGARGAGHRREPRVPRRRVRRSRTFCRGDSAPRGRDPPRRRVGAAHSDLGTAFMAHGASGRSAGAPAARRRARAARRGHPVQPRQRAEQGVAAGEAAAAYERALAINPEFPDAHVNLGTLLFSRGRVKEALPHFERAVELQPNSAVIHSNLGSALAASGRYADALREFQRALALNPEYGPALENVQRLQQMGIR